MNDNKSNKKQNDDTQQVLQDHGVQDVVPKDEEYYTLDLRRGDDTDVNDPPEIQVVGNNPLDKSAEETLVENEEELESSNAGGPVKTKDIVNQNTDAGVVPGEPGHWGVDEDTG